jgi:hypothetical protein
MTYVCKNVLILGILIDSPVYFAGKSITKTNNSRIFKKMQIISRYAYRARRSCLMKKQETIIS